MVKVRCRSDTDVDMHLNRDWNIGVDLNMDGILLTILYKHWILYPIQYKWFFYSKYNRLYSVSTL